MINLEQRRNRTISVREIDDALREEWARLSTQIEEQTGSPPLRTTISTLVVIAPAGPDARAIHNTLPHLVTAVPSRVILFVPDPAASEFSAQVWAHCNLDRRGTYASCYDVIEIALPVRGLAAVPNIVAIHRLGELPTFLIWTGRPDLDNPVTQAVVRIADRLILDTEQYDYPLVALEKYATLLGTVGTAVAGGDLAWTRLATWRELIAQSFDMPVCARMIRNISRIEISYDSGSESSAILLGSWITSRLGCAPVSVEQVGDLRTLIAFDDSGDCRVQIGLQQTLGAELGIRAIRIMARSPEGASRISVQRLGPDRTAVRVDATGMPRQERVVHHPKPPRQELIAAELMRHGRDRIFEEALAQAAGFAYLFRQEVAAQ